MTYVPNQNLFLPSLDFERAVMRLDEDDGAVGDDYLDFVKRKGNLIPELAPEPGRMDESDVTPAGAAAIGLATAEVRWAHKFVI